MKNILQRDRFLSGILIFIGVLVIVALGLFFLRSRAPAYGPEDTPQGVVYNYAVALQLGDYPRAYRYMARLPDQPSLDAFERAFLAHQIDPSTSTLQVGPAQVLPDGEAWVDVTIQYASSGVFDSGSAVTQKATLIKQGSAWKITSLPYPYWGFDWYTPTPLPPKTP